MAVPDAGPAPADAIYVFAGMMERKEHALALWRRGLAPTMLLSVARFEWRRIPRLALPSDGGLVDLVEATPPPERLFFITLAPGFASARRVPVGRFGTAAEASALVEEAAANGWRTVLVVTSWFHFPRARVALERLGRGRACRFHLVAVPDACTDHPRARWWSRPATLGYIVRELIRWPLYRMLPAGFLVPRARRSP